MIYCAFHYSHYSFAGYCFYRFNFDVGLGPFVAETTPTGGVNKVITVEGCVYIVYTCCNAILKGDLNADSI